MIHPAVGPEFGPFLSVLMLGGTFFAGHGLAFVQSRNAKRQPKEDNTPWHLPLRPSSALHCGSSACSES
jgi:hypothetical protein